jgi:hypothetical protein
MSRNGNGSRTGNGNGTGKKAWDLKKDGILWKKVIEHSSQAFQKAANGFVVQLQESVQPADALQGLLLDRIAASYLRKQLLLEMEATARLGKRVKDAGGTLSSAELQKPTSISVTFPLECHLSADVLRYEALLDQGFHRDLILLQKLKEMAPVSDTRGRRPLKSERGLIEGGSTSDAVSQV